MKPQRIHHHSQPDAEAANKSKTVHWNNTSQASTISSTSDKFSAGHGSCSSSQSNSTLQNASYRVKSTNSERTTLTLAQSQEPSSRAQMATTNPPEQQPRKRVWRSAVDPKSGRTYYYDVHTRETQWRKPLELASDSERQALARKEQQQKEFFASMEANILKCMQVGQVPGMSPSLASSSPPILEDQVKTLPRSQTPMSSKVTVSDSRSSGVIDKPKLLRTISSMDDKILQELTRECCSISPNSTTTSYFNEPHRKNGLKQRPNVSRADSCPPMSLLRENHDNPLPSFATRDETMIKSCTQNDGDCDLNSAAIPKPSLSKRNSCGTLYVRNTMAAPDKEAAIKVKREHGLISNRDHFVYFKN